MKTDGFLHVRASVTGPEGPQAGPPFPYRLQIAALERVLEQRHRMRVFTAPGRWEAVAARNGTTASLLYLSWCRATVGLFFESHGLAAVGAKSGVEDEAPTGSSPTERVLRFRVSGPRAAEAFCVVTVHLRFSPRPFRPLVFPRVAVTALAAEDRAGRVEPFPSADPNVSRSKLSSLGIPALRGPCDGGRGRSTGPRGRVRP